MCPCLPWYLTAVGLMCHLLSDPNSRNRLCSTLLPFRGLIGSTPWGCFTCLRGLTQNPHVAQHLGPITPGSCLHLPFPAHDTKASHTGR